MQLSLRSQLIAGVATVGAAAMVVAPPATGMDKVR